MAAMPPEMPILPHAEALHHNHDFSKRILMALIIASCFLASILVILTFFWIYRLRKSRKSVSIPQTPSSHKFHLPTSEFSRIAAATNDFHRRNLIEERENTALYKACFGNEHHATVRIISEGEKNIDAKFRNEVVWLTKMHHKNIIFLEGHCINGGTRFLVYEPIQNGSLASQLQGGSSMSWHVRIMIAVDVARALEFLHEHANPLVLRNLSSSNILLDSNFSAKISDFGLATQRLLSESSVRRQKRCVCVRRRFIGALNGKNVIGSSGHS